MVGKQFGGGFGIGVLEWWLMENKWKVQCFKNY